jgi:hypothetical protein
VRRSSSRTVARLVGCGVGAAGPAPVSGCSGAAGVTHPVGVSGHSRFLATVRSPAGTAAALDYAALLASESPSTIGHEVLVTVTVERRRVRVRHRSGSDPALDALVEETRLLAGRLESAGTRVDGPLTVLELSTAPGGAVRPGLYRYGRAGTTVVAAAGRGSIEGVRWPSRRTGCGRVDGASSSQLPGACLADVAGPGGLSPRCSPATASRDGHGGPQPVPLAQAAGGESGSDELGSRPGAEGTPRVPSHRP